MTFLHDSDERQLLFVILASFTTHLAIIGGCRHLFYLSPQQQLQAVKYNWISQPWGIFGFATGKISVALLILRIMGPNTIWRKWILYGCMASVLVINAIGSILTFVQCNPPRALWTPTIHAHCWNPKVQSDYAIFLSSEFHTIVVFLTTANHIASAYYYQVGMCSSTWSSPCFPYPSFGLLLSASGRR